MGLGLSLNSFVEGPHHVWNFKGLKHILEVQALQSIMESPIVVWQAFMWAGNELVYWGIYCRSQWPLKCRVQMYKHVIISGPRNYEKKKKKKKKPV